VFETNIRYVGGLLTLYSFTGDVLYKEKAIHIVDKLMPAFKTPTGIPYALVNMRTGVSIFCCLLRLINICLQGYKDYTGNENICNLFSFNDRTLKTLVGPVVAQVFYLSLEHYIWNLLI
jgi:hypothetical protein